MRQRDNATTRCARPRQVAEGGEGAVRGVPRVRAGARHSQMLRTATATITGTEKTSGIAKYGASRSTSHV